MRAREGRAEGPTKELARDLPSTIAQTTRRLVIRAVAAGVTRRVFDWETLKQGPQPFQELAF